MNDLEIYIRSEIGALKRFLEDMSREGASATVNEIGYGLAMRIADAVRTGYETVFGPLSPATIETYAQGKRRGAKPSRSIWGGLRPLYRSGQLSRSVVVRKTSTGYRIEIDPGKTYSMGDAADRGKSLARVAAQLENPVPQIIPITQRSLAYLQLLRRGRAGPPNAMSAFGARRGVGVIGQVLVWPRPRPVWRTVGRKIGDFFRDMSPEAAKLLRRRFLVSRSQAGELNTHIKM